MRGVAEVALRMEDDPHGDFRELMLSFGSQQYAVSEVAPR